MSRTLRLSLWAVLILVNVPQASRAQSLDTQKSRRDSLAFFEQHVRPLLVDRCIKCHGPKKSESGLRLDTQATSLKGGDGGPAVVPGQPDDSLLIVAVRHEEGLQMPPDDKLNGQEIAALTHWIQQGAVWPEGAMLAGKGPQLRGGPITDEERGFWSFQPVTDPTPPEIAGAAQTTAIDRFVNARLQAAGLKAAGPADKRTLIRRATFDLIGLPPTPDEIQSFLGDESPDAFAKVVERLLASQAYGERWGRHWLDVVRYADTAGETADYPSPLAYKYRNWVINAFNADMHYDQFVREQIAGDILGQRMVEQATQLAGSSSANVPLPEDVRKQYQSMITATGFIAISRRFGFDVENYHHLTIQDTIDTVGQSVLGLTLGCARCHDHKYDPVNVQDYYAWYGVFDSTKYSFPGSEEKKRPYDLFPALPPHEAQRAKAEYDAKLEELDNRIKELDAAEKTDANAQLRKELEATRVALTQAGPYELVFAVAEKEAGHNVQIQIRGDERKLGDEAPRKNLEILGNDPLPADAGSGRLQMANWLTRADNPLMPRVMVNRIWQQHFGRGIVGSENDFGARGESPTHPELLDWLASRFIESGYSIKAMHRLIMMSAAYQRATDYDSVALEADPDARLFWRFNRRRLSAEEIRDAMLAVSGNLDPTMGESHPFPPVETWGFSQHGPFYAVYPTNRRSIYLMQQRLKRHPFLALFDGADTNASTARRELTTVPTQALFLMNNEFVHDQGRGLAQRLIAAGADEPTRIEAAYELALGRPASESERSDALTFLADYRAALAQANVPEAQREQAVWSGYARTLLIRNEFLFVD